MIYKIREQNKNVVSNTTAQHPLEISDLFNFTVSIKEPVFIDHVDLFFKVDGEGCSGSLLIDIAIDNKFARFSILYNSLRNDAPLRLLLESHPHSGKKIDVFLRPLQITKPVHLWINSTGPCIVVNGDVSMDVELKKTPLISVVTPIYKSDLGYLKETIKSVESQIYTNWEMRLVDDGSNNAKLVQFLHTIDNPQIKIKINRKNRGIGEATNIAIEETIGDYVCFLDHDDTLTADALLGVAQEINKFPYAKLIYTDEDKISEDGSYVEHFYKPDWSYSMFLSQNYVCHLSTYRADILKAIGGTHRGYEGSQDHDMTLRFIEKIDENDIRHIPRILYHWRKHDNSTSSSISNKPYAHIGGLCAIRDHLFRIKEDARVLPGRYFGSYHVDYKVREDPLIHIVIPTNPTTSFKNDTVGV